MSIYGESASPAPRRTEETCIISPWLIRARHKRVRCGVFREQVSRRPKRPAWRAARRNAHAARTRAFMRAPARLRLR